METHGTLMGPSWDPRGILMEPSWALTPSLRKVAKGF